MKRYILLAITMFFVCSVSAQNDADALRLSQYIYGGTARTISMGGAFGALGGDFGSLSINPAGIAVYRSSEFTLTPTMNYSNSQSDYLLTKYTDRNSTFLLGNLGFVSARSSNKSDGWVSTGFGLGYNRIANYNNSTFVTGLNKSSSLLDNFIQHADGLYPASTIHGPYLDQYYEQLAYDANLIYSNNVTSSHPTYNNDLAFGGYNQLQSQSIITTGGIGEYVISFGANYNHKLYLGASLGIQQASYNEVKQLTESNINNNIPYLNSFSFSESYNIHGTGYAFKVGAIYRPIEMLRLGLAVHFPTYYNLHSEFHTDLTAKFDSVYTADPQQSPSNRFDYSLTTPWRMIGSVAVQLGQIGVISMDIERVNYNTMWYFGSDLRDENDTIQKYYKPSYNFRLGAEVKLAGIALRAGYALYGSPYVKGFGNDNASTSNFSAGIGFKGSRFFCDIGYVMSLQKSNYILYTTQDAGQTFANQAALINKNSQIMATIGFRF